MKTHVIRPRQVEFDWIDDNFNTPDPWAEPGEDCPDLDRLRAAAAAELPLAERQKILDHAVRCRYCADSWRLALQLGARPEVSLKAQFLAILWADLHFVMSLPRRLSRSRAGRVVAQWLDVGPHGQALPVQALAALAVLVLGLVLYFSQVALFHPQIDPSGTVRGGKRGAVAVTPAPLTPLVADGAALPRDSFVLRWSGPAEASYDVEVTGPGGVRVASASGLGAGEYRVAAEELSGLAAGTVLTWRVRMWLADGSLAQTREWLVRLE